MNLAETAFLVRRSDGFDLRWFTPLCEVDLCGHATLASAHALVGRWSSDRRAAARFHTRSGLLTAERRDGLIWLDFPSTPAEPAVTAARARERPRRAARVRRADAVRLSRRSSSREDDVARVEPDLAALGTASGAGRRSSPPRSSTPSYDFVSRFFAPAAGVPEDPGHRLRPLCACAVLGRAAGAKRADRLPGVGARRASVRVRLAGDRVLLGGHAVTVVAGRAARHECRSKRSRRWTCESAGSPRAEPNERARKPSYKLWIDFGPLGEKTSSAQLRALYSARGAGRPAGDRGGQSRDPEHRRIHFGGAGAGRAERGRERSCCSAPSGTSRSAAGCTRSVGRAGVRGIVGHRPHHQAGHLAVLGQAPLDQHRALRRVERCPPAVDPERLGVVHLLVHRAPSRARGG